MLSRTDAREQRFPLGAAVTLDELDRDPHPVLARLRAREPVSWLPCLDGWLVTRHDLVLAAMRDSERFTVDDPRFSTAQVVGPSMLSRDGEAHARHRAPFVAPFRAAEVAGRFEAATAESARRLLAGLAPAGHAELRRRFAGPLAAAVMAHALGLAVDEVDDLLGWYEAIVASVTSITAGEGPTAGGTAASAALAARLEEVIAGGGGSLVGAAAGAGMLAVPEVVSNAAILLFGGIETTEGMITSALLALLTDPVLRENDTLAPDLLDGVIDESLRLEPAAAVVDRYATADTELGGAHIELGELVRISLAGANRDPAIFPQPDRFDPGRENLRRHVAFAQGPHVCVGVHLARLETRAALRELRAGLPGLRLDPGHPVEVRGLVFRKPVALHVTWDH